MQTVFSTQDSLLLYHLKNLLEQEQIPCLLEQIHLQGAMGELPLTAWPRLVVPQKDLVSKAKAIIEEALKPSKNLSAIWPCPVCGEQIEHQFAACWKCGTLRKKNQVLS